MPRKGNVDAYKRKVRTDPTALIVDFSYNYTTAEMGYTSTGSQDANFPYGYPVSQSLFSNVTGQPAEVTSSYFGYVSSKEIVEGYPLGGGALVVKIPFKDKDTGEVSFYWLCKVYDLGDVYDLPSWGGGYKYRSGSIAGGISLDGETIDYNTFSTSGVLFNYYYNRDIDCKLFLYGIYGKYDDKNCFSVGLLRQDYNPYSGYQGYFLGMTPLYPLEDLNAEEDTYYFSDTFGEETEPQSPNNGSFDFSSDTIPLPDEPTAGISTSGFANIYAVTQNDLTGFVNDLFPPFNGITLPTLPVATTELEALKNMVEGLVNICVNLFPLAEMWINKGLIDFIIDCHIIPVQPDLGLTQPIQVAWKTFTQSAPVVTDDYTFFDCGTLDADTLHECYASFLDYSETQAKLFLPFIGFVPIDPELFQSGELNVSYRFNIVDGSFMAYVKSTSSKSALTDTVVGQYSGNCCVHIPITGANYSNILSGAIAFGSSVALAGASGGTSAALSAAGSGIGTVANLRPQKEGSNGYSASSSFLSVRRPFLMIERPDADTNLPYLHAEGVPLNSFELLADMQGFTQCEAPVLKGFQGADAEELEEIKRLLEEGIILPLNA